MIREVWSICWHREGQKLDSTKGQEKTSIYVDDENVAALEKTLKSNFMKIFDFDAGSKFNPNKISAPKKEAKIDYGYEQQEKPKPEKSIDQWV